MLAKFPMCVCVDGDATEINEHAKRTWPISSLLELTNFLKDFINAIKYTIIF